MSEQHMHVHGAHEHAVEHEAHRGPGLAQQVAIFTAVLSTIGAVTAYMGAATQNEAMLYKNEAVLKKAEASDQWNYYQSKSTKGHLAELAARLSRDPAQVEFYNKEARRYDQEKKAIKAQAEALDEESHKANEKSERAMHPLHRLEQAMTLIQIAISLASITALTRKRWLLVVAACSAAGGLGLLGWALAH
ncbi:MAG TPA: DUF4337 domain-containing protein [Burkholderiales bacterium]|nr:DUF4337 domain-containing protein [Burkholderiales bacterium]